MGRRSEHSRTELRQLIIDATGELVDTHGVGKVTARMIAEAVEYTPGMLYSVFRNLEDIFLHVNELSLEELHEVCKSAAEAQASPREALLALGQSYINFALTRTHRFELMFSQSMTETLAPTSQFNEKTQELFDLIKHQLTKINPDANNAALEIGTRSLWCGVHGATTSAMSNQIITRVWRADSDLVRALINHYLDGWTNEFGQ
ncbi:MAG: TetR/AcrR family transcriptional regulator [Granulosicoccus sp.]|nr:TetR/AcrR family transcriptional regulator [Granulosicoccus sp.]